MKLHKLKVEMDFQLEGRKYRITAISPPNVYAIKAGSDKEDEFDYIELISNDTFFSLSTIVRKSIKEKDKNHISQLDKLNEKQRAIVSARFEIIRPLLLLEGAKAGNVRAAEELTLKYKPFLQMDNFKNLLQEELIERICAVYGVSKRTIKRRLSAYRSEESNLPNEGLTALIPKTVKQNLMRKDYFILELCHPRKRDLVLDYIRVQLAEDCAVIVKDVIENQYLTLKKPSAVSVFETIEGRCLLDGIKAPSYITVYKILKRISPEVQARMRLGKSGDEEFTQIERGFSNREAKYPLHIVEVDHTELDIDIIDERTGYVIGRPYITLGICVFSRMVWCMEVTFEPPSAEKVRRALMQGIFFKNAKRKYNTINEWDIYGIPTIIYFDNGPEFKNAAVKRMINETLQSQVQFRPVKTPRYGGTIERLFGTINSELIHRLHGTRKGSVIAKGEYDSEKEAVLTLEDIQELLTVYITDVYHHSVHKGLPIQFPTPSARYYAGIEMVGFPEWVDPEDEDKYRMELLPIIMKPYRRDGVRHENLIYRSHDHKSLVQPRDFKYKIKYDSDDISRLYLQLPETGEYIELLAYQDYLDNLAGMNRYTYRRILEILKESGEVAANKIPGSKDINKGILLLRDRIQKKYKSRRRSREQAARMNMDVTVNIAQPPSTPKDKNSVMTLKDLFGQLDSKGNR